MQLQSILFPLRASEYSMYIVALVALAIGDSTRAHGWCIIEALKPILLTQPVLGCRTTVASTLAAPRIPPKDRTLMCKDARMHSLHHNQFHPDNHQLHCLCLKKPHQRATNVPASFTSVPARLNLAPNLSVYPNYQTNVKNNKSCHFCF